MVIDGSNKSRYIDADELNEILNWTCIKPPFSKKQVRKYIELCRTADVRENTHSYWEECYRPKFDGTRYWFRKCHVCEYERGDDNTDLDTPYCPRCGASMGREMSDDELPDMWWKTID